MDINQLRAMFNQAIEKETDADRIAKIELLREYFTNDEFKTKLQDHVWNLTK